MRRHKLRVGSPPAPSHPEVPSCTPSLHTPAAQWPITDGMAPSQHQAPPCRWAPSPQQCAPRAGAAPQQLRTKGRCEGGRRDVDADILTRVPRLPWFLLAAPPRRPTPHVSTLSPARLAPPPNASAAKLSNNNTETGASMGVERRAPAHPTPVRAGGSPAPGCCRTLHPRRRRCREGGWQGGWVGGRVSVRAEVRRYAHKQQRTLALPHTAHPAQPTTTHHHPAHQPTHPPT